jgi:VWFA-related protein
MALSKQWLLNFVLLVVFCIVVQSQSNAPSTAAPVSQQQSSQQQSPTNGATSANRSNNDAQNQQPAPADEKPQKVYESATVLKTVTRLVVVDVVVTDNKGSPIGDLTADNFTVLEDGKPQKIRVFNFQHPAAAPAQATAVQASLKLPPNVFSNVPKYDVHNTLNVVLLDALNTKSTNQAYARDQMLKYLEKMPTDQPIAVYGLTTKLRILQDFTTDPTVLRGLLKNLNSKSSPLLSDATGNGEAQIFPPGLFDSMPQQMQQSILAFEQENANAQTEIRVDLTLAALKAIARNLAGYPGRKNLIWLSEAFPLNIDPNLDIDGSGFSTGSTRDFGPDVAQAADALMNAQVAVYPVDAQGLVGNSYFSAGNNGSDRLGRSLSRGDRLGRSIGNENGALFDNHSTMNDLAERTGGKAFYNRNDIDAAIGHSIADGSTYYTLAYYPENKNWDGKFRKISIKVNRSGAKVRNRLGYYASDPRGGFDPKVRQAAFAEALDLDFPISTGLLFEAGVIQPSTKTENKLMINFAVDPHAIVFENRGDGLQHASVACAVHIYTEKGKQVRTEMSGIDAALKPDMFQKVMMGRFPCQNKINLAPGNYILRLGVIDNSTGLLGTANARVTVLTPAPETAATKPQGNQQ